MLCWLPSVAGIRRPGLFIGVVLLFFMGAGSTRGQAPASVPLLKETSRIDVQLEKRVPGIGQWQRVVPIRDVAFLPGTQGLHRVSLRGSGTAPAALRYWSPPGAPEACTGGTFSLMDMTAFANGEAFVFNGAPGLLQSVRGAAIGAPIAETDSCVTVVRLDAETFVCAETWPDGGRRKNVLSIRDRQWQVLAEAYPISWIGQTPVAAMRIATDGARIYACEMKDPILHVFDRGGGELLKLDMSGTSYARPPTAGVPADQDLHVFVRDWFRQYSPIVSVAAGASLVGISYKIPGGFHTVLARAATGERVLEIEQPEALILESIEEGRILFSDRDHLIVAYRLVEPAAGEARLP